MEVFGLLRCASKGHPEKESPGPDGTGSSAASALDSTEREDRTWIDYETRKSWKEQKKKECPSIQLFSAGGTRGHAMHLESKTLSLQGFANGDRDFI